MVEPLSVGAFLVATVATWFDSSVKASATEAVKVLMAKLLECLPHPAHRDVAEFEKNPKNPGRQYIISKLVEAQSDEVKNSLFEAISAVDHILKRSERSEPANLRVQAKGSIVSMQGSVYNSTVNNNSSSD